MKFYSFRQLCDLGFLSLLSTESADNTTPLFQSDMIDNGLVNFTLFLNYIRKHIDRLTIRAGKQTFFSITFLLNDYFSEHFTTIT